MVSLVSGTANKDFMWDDVGTLQDYTVLAVSFRSLAVLEPSAKR